MSKATKRKHVTKEVLDNFILPDENQQIVRVICCPERYEFSIDISIEHYDFSRLLEGGETTCMKC